MKATIATAFVLALASVSAIGADLPSPDDLGKGGFPTIDSGVLILLGIRGSSYVVSKGIQKNYEAATGSTDQSAGGGTSGGKQWPAPSPSHSPSPGP